MSGVEKEWQIPSLAGSRDLIDDGGEIARIGSTLFDSQQVFRAGRL